MINWGRDKRTVNALQYCFQWVTCGRSKAEVQTWTFEGLGQRMQSKNLIVGTKQLMLKREETLSNLDKMIDSISFVDADKSSGSCSNTQRLSSMDRKNVTLNPHKDCFATVWYIYSLQTKESTVR